jgi:L-threonylcarbamoyladenylate synthase
VSSTVDQVAAAVGRGEPVLVPTDTVYGLASAPTEDAVRRLYRLKGREDERPTALVAADLDTLLECVPELEGRAATIARALLPGAFTLVLPNPAGRFPWLTGPRTEAIGVRVPALAGTARELLDRVGALAATSANLPGGPDPRALGDVPERLRQAVGAALDGGTLPGTASTVLDCTGAEPVVLRAGAAPVDEALRRLRAALA